MAYHPDMTDAKPKTNHDGFRSVRRPYAAPVATKLGKIEDLTSAGSGGIKEHGMGTASTFSVA